MQTKQTDKKMTKIVTPESGNTLEFQLCKSSRQILNYNNYSSGKVAFNFRREIFIFRRITQYVIIYCDRHTMGKPRPHKKKASKSREKSVLSAGGSISKRKMNEDPAKLLQQATILLQAGQLDEALSLAQQALESAPANSPALLSSQNAVAGIYVEMGEVDLARKHFLRAVELDPTGSIPESEGGGAEKFLWLAQLSELGGKDSVQWFEKGVVSLRNDIQQLEADAGPAQVLELEEKKGKMATALCGVAEIYMTDLS